MLDRETCERLAEVLPEVRSHRRCGDFYYLPTEMGHPVMVVGYEPNGILAAWTEWGLDYAPEGGPNCMTLGPRVTKQGLLWCPRLEDLLALAIGGEEKSLVYHPAERLWSGKTSWRFGEADDYGEIHESCDYHDTPEAAVAAWLIAHAPAKEAAP